jgi:hypothetical protein
LQHVRSEADARGEDGRENMPRVGGADQVPVARENGVVRERKESRKMRKKDR